MADPVGKLKLIETFQPVGKLKIVETFGVSDPTEDPIDLTALQTQDVIPGVPRDFQDQEPFVSQFRDEGAAISAAPEPDPVTLKGTLEKIALSPTDTALAGTGLGALLSPKIRQNLGGLLGLPASTFEELTALLPQSKREPDFKNIVKSFTGDKDISAVRPLENILGQKDTFKDPTILQDIIASFANPLELLAGGAIGKGFGKVAKGAKLESIKKALGTPTGKGQTIALDELISARGGFVPTTKTPEEILEKALTKRGLSKPGQNLIPDIPEGLVEEVDKIPIDIPQPSNFTKDLTGFESNQPISLMSPDRVINEVTGTPDSIWHRRIVDPWKEALDNTLDRETAINLQIADISKKFNVVPGSAKDVALRRFGEGIATAKEKALLTDKDKGILTTIRSLYDEALEEINIARSTRGLGPIERRPDFFTHISELNFADRAIGSIANIPLDQLKGSKVSKVGKAPFTPFALQRTGKKTVTAGKISGLKKEGGLGGQVASLLEKFATTDPPGALSGLNLYLKKASDIAERIGAANLIEPQLDNLPPNAKKWFTTWLNRSVLGKQFGTERELPATFGLFESLQRGISSSFVSGSIRTALLQPSSLAQTIQLAGLRNTITGLPKMFSKNISLSKIVKSRKGVPDIDAIGFKKPTLKKFNDFLNIPLSAFDRMQVRIAASAARQLGIKRGLKGARLDSFMDRVASMSQAETRTGLKAGIQENRIGRAATPLQTFVINLYNTIRRDPKILAEGSKLKNLKVLMAGVGGMAAVNQAYDAAGMTAPFQITDFIPLFGGFLKFGTINPVLEQVRQVGQLILGEGREHQRAKKNAWKLPFRFVPGGSQAIRTIEGIPAVQEGASKTPTGRTRFKIEGLPEQLRALTLGPFQTKAGQDFFESKGKKKKKGFR